MVHNFNFGQISSSIKYGLVSIEWVYWWSRQYRSSYFDYAFYDCNSPSKHSSWWRRLSSSSSEDVFKTSSRRLDQDEFVRLSLTSSEDVFKTSSRRLGQDQYIRLGHMSSRRLPDVFKTSSRRFEDVFKTSSKRLQDLFKASSRRLQDICKTPCKYIFKTFSRRTVKLICSS